MMHKLPSVIIGKFNQLIDIDDFLYRFNTLATILTKMSKIRFVREYDKQLRIVRGSLNSPLLSDELRESYTNIQIVLDTFKVEFDILYPQKDYPELLI